ncbi:MAG: prephenate dehydrogenase/arogenate dehydrogenase family protein [wastewater metagenome]|nr:prephenate dehydrogenase/arogenate dehydrogenase family protein [Candidatus Loosdrechtia aerotolerans]
MFQGHSLKQFKTLTKRNQVCNIWSICTCYDISFITLNYPRKLSDSKPYMQFETVCIIGPGLIGGSIGLGLKKRNLARTVIGVSHRASSLEKARKVNAIDIGVLQVDKAVKDADIVILATSVNQIIHSVREVLPFMKSNAILTDVGSTKGCIVEHINRNKRDDVAFVGVHPIAGSEKKGVEFASPDLFVDSTCIITPSHAGESDDERAGGRETGDSDSHPCNSPFSQPRSDYSAALETVTCLWQLLGAKIVFMSPQQHDEILAQVSHLPHLVATCLINAIRKEHLQYGASGLRDTTRVASGDPALWLDIFDQNRENIIKSIDQLVNELSGFKEDLSNKDNAGLLNRLKAAKLLRDSVFNTKSKSG